MSSGFLALLAFAPILLAGILLLGLRWPARTAMPVVFLATAVLGYTAWDMTLNRIFASTLQGLVITSGVVWIIFGAILLLNTLKHPGAIATILSGFTNITPHTRAQPLLLVWLV